MSTRLRRHCWNRSSACARPASRWHPKRAASGCATLFRREYQEEELVAAARQIFSLGWRALKLYFMLGLPSETEEDLMGIVDLSTKVAAAGNFRAQVTASVSTFVPKSHTPFQWAAQIPIAETEARQRFLRRELGKRRIQFRWHDARLSYLEGIFSRGDRRTGALLQRAFELGCRFDGWNDACRFDLWEQALRDTELSADFYMRRRLLDEPLPWDHLSSGVTKAFLQRELANAFERTLTPDCSVERCTYCGACDFTTIRNVDYHVRGAKGADHRGDVIDHWASDIVAGSAEPGAWEPRGWHKIQGKAHEQHPEQTPAPPQLATRLRPWPTREPQHQATSPQQAWGMRKSGSRPVARHWRLSSTGPPHRRWHGSGSRTRSSGAPASSAASS